ncbi:replication protein A 70 kDa dna-binding subunit-like, partial [Trifolium medium]|nr:replication protein A 70 kDa dna-binding subunit-like [Trifolium medium]
MAVNLTQGAIARICNSDNFSFINKYKPVLQVVHSRHPNILWLSDGSAGSLSIPGILSPNLEELMTSRKLQKSSVVKLTRFIVDKQVHNGIVILDLEVILDKCKPIGEPTLLTEIALPLPNVADLQFFNSRTERMTVNLTQG